MYCPKCKEEIRLPRGPYHNWCGTKLIDYKLPAPSCRFCNKELYKTERYCPFCGKEVKSWIRRNVSNLFFAVFLVLLSITMILEAFGIHFIIDFG